MAAPASLVESALRMSRNLGGGFVNYMGKGLVHNLGGETSSAVGRAVNMEFFGRTITHQAGYLPVIGPVSKPMGGVEKLWAGGQVLGAVASVGFGFAEGGIPGAIKNLVTDVGVDAALARHGYNGITRAGVTTFTHKGLVNTVGRAAIGSMTAYGVRSALGGGIIGTAGSLIGGSLGVRHAGKIAMAAAGYMGARAVARGTYNILRAGNSHFQASKQIQTDGDMASFFTSGSFTMRSRAVSAIQRSHSNARTALGKEATYMSFPQRSYQSPYRQF